MREREVCKTERGRERECVWERKNELKREWKLEGGKKIKKERERETEK